ncbi:MAG: hypothetical protein ACOY33_02595 [Pseudomonadota bacterium]
MSVVAAAADTGRIDPYTRIHKALRARLCATLVAAGRCDGSDPQDTGNLLADLRETLAMLQRHRELENRFLHPALEARRPGSTRTAAGDHARQEREIDELLAIAFRLEHLPQLRRAALATRLHHDFSRLVAGELEHMALEEREHNRLLWETHSDDELRALEQAIHADITPQEKGLSLRWMLPNLTAGERAGLVAGLQARQPAAQFADTLAGLLPLLDAGQRQQLAAALGLEFRPTDYVGMA